MAVAATACLSMMANWGGAFSVESLAARIDQLGAWVAQRPAASVSLYCMLYLAAASAPFPPATALTLACGALIGFWPALALTSAVSTTACACVFVAARRLFGRRALERYGQRLGKVRSGVERDGAYYVFMLRMVPLFPFFGLNWLLSMTPVRVAPFALASQLGMLPATAVYVNAGVELGRLQTGADILSPRLALALAALGALPLLSRLAWRHWRRRLDASR